jgi:hypothetical protein
MTATSSVLTVRQPHDFYPTPAWVVHRLLEAVRLPAGHWCDPCAGDGAILRAADVVRRDVIWTAIEIRPECEGDLEATGAIVVLGDALSCEWQFRPEPITVVITNPPYSLAEPFLRRALTMAPMVAFLLRLDFLGSAKRCRLFHEAVPDVYPLPNRPSFVGGGTDKYDYAWFVWPPMRRRRAGYLSVLADTPRAVRLPRAPRPTLEVHHAHQ